MHLQFRLFSPQKFVFITGFITDPLITVVWSAITVRNEARNTITVQIARNGARYKDRNVAVYTHIIITVPALRVLQPLRGFDTDLFAIWPPRAHQTQPMAQDG